MPRACQTTGGEKNETSLSRAWTRLLRISARGRHDHRDTRLPGLPGLLPQLPRVREEGQRSRKGRVHHPGARWTGSHHDDGAARRSEERRSRHGVLGVRLLRCAGARVRRGVGLHHRRTDGAQERRHGSAQPDPPEEDRRLQPRLGRQRHSLQPLVDQGAQARLDRAHRHQGLQGTRPPDLSGLPHQLPRRPDHQRQLARSLHRARARHGRDERLDANWPDGSELGPLSQVPHPAGLLLHRPAHPHEPEEVAGAVAEVARDPAAGRHPPRERKPRSAAEAVEGRRGRAQEARRQNRGAVARGLEALLRGRAGGEPCAHEGAHGEVRRHGELREDHPAVHAGTAAQIKKLLFKAYDAVLYGMAWTAAFLIAAMMVIITVDVGVRNFCYQSSSHFFTFTEYALLIVPCLGAPWLVREKGHIYVEILLMHLKPRARRWMMRFIAVACIAVCLVIAWYGFGVTLADFRGAERDVRSFDMPRWLVVGWIPLAFLMMAIEFARYLWRVEDFLPPFLELLGS